MRLWLVILLVATAGVLRDVSVVFWKAGPLKTSRIDDRFAELLPRLPQRLGFLTDVPGDLAGSRFFDAQYAVAPRTVVQGPDEAWILADVADPRSLEEICTKWKLRVVAPGGPGVALLERQ